MWGYGLRYRYGIFQQLIAPDGSQLEAPDPWLEHDNPWELPRADVSYEVRFYGHSERLDGMKAVWSGGQEVLAVAYDTMVPGYATKNTNNLRLWESKPKRGFDLNSFNGALLASRLPDAVLTCLQFGIVSSEQLATTSAQSSPPTARRRSPLCSTRTTTRPVSLS